MSKKTVNEDLQQERQKCDFNTEELTNFLDGDVKFTRNRRRIENKVLSVKGLLDEIPEEYLSHKEKYENAIRKGVLLYKVLQGLEDPSFTEEEIALSKLRLNVVAAVFKDNSPFSLHTSMFIPAIQTLGNEEQREYWLKRSRNMEIIGTYAQTELGHGTFVRGLETTATYDSATGEFILHSPTLSSYKWWPGGLAHTANYCIVMANLYTKGKSCGIQPFMVQIRDENTHMPLPGVKLGEIGAKLGFNTTNNGFLGLDNYRLPKDRMLSRNAQILKDGSFVASPNSKLNYGTMVFVRVTIVRHMASLLEKAATISIRYSAVRRQSQPKPNEPEPQILDYVTQQHKLFIAIASSHAFGIAARWLWDFYTKVTKDLTVANMDDLPELHSLSCCLKAVTTIDAAGMIERCRLACGGHGYMMASSLPQAYGVATASCTYEGEQTVLMLQTARYLAKAYQKAQQGETLSPSTAYLLDKNPLKTWDGSVDGIIQNFKIVAAGKLKSSINSMEKHMKKGLAPEDAWNMSSVQLVAASDAHCRAVLLSVYKSELDQKTQGMSAPVKKVLYQMMELYALYWAIEKVGDLLQYTSISSNDVQDLQYRYEELLLKIRPNAVGLVDAYDFRDEILTSALGSYDGRVYERLMEEALKSPLNAEPVNQSFHKYLKPFMQGKL